MSPRRLLSHYKVDSRRDRLLTVSCNAEDMLLPRSNFTFTGKLIIKLKCLLRNLFKFNDIQVSLNLLVKYF